MELRLPVGYEAVVLTWRLRTPRRACWRSPPGEPCDRADKVAVAASDLHLARTSTMKPHNERFPSNPAFPPPFPQNTNELPKQGLKRKPSDDVERPPLAEVMSPSAVRQAWEDSCSRLAGAIGHPALRAQLDRSPQRLRHLLASGHVRLEIPQHDVVGTAPWWVVHTPESHDEREALVDLGTLLIDAGAPAAKHGVALLLHVLSAGFAGAHKASVRQKLVQATLARLASSGQGMLSPPQWLPVLCEALSLSPPPADRDACETMLKHWLQAWCNDEDTCIEPSRVVEQLRQVLVAQTDVPRNEQDDATLVFFVEELFKGALKRKAGAEAEWALRVLQQWTGPAAGQAFARCMSQMPISEDLKGIEILGGQCCLKEGDHKALLALGKNSPELFLKLLYWANFPVRTRHLLRLARHQGQDGPPVRRFGPGEGVSPAGIVPPRFFHELALLLLREAIELLRTFAPSLDDVSALAQAGLAYLLRSDALLSTNLQARKNLEDLVRILVGLLDQSPGSATASRDVQLMCLEVLGRWRATALHLDPEQVLCILRSLDVSGQEAGVPPFVARMELGLALHHLHDTVAAHSGDRPNSLELLEKIAGLHEDWFEHGSFRRERTMSGRARTMLEVRNWQPRSLDDLRLSIELIATPQEQRRVIEHLLQYAQQPSALEPEVCVRAATLLCHCTARNPDPLAPAAWTAAPLLDRTLELAWTCARLLSRVPEAGQHQADDLFAGAALVLGSPRLEPGPAREQWEHVGDLLLKGFEERAYRVENDMLLQLFEAHVRVPRLDELAARALIQLYLQDFECRPAILKVLETLASRNSAQAKAALKECLEADRLTLREQQAQALRTALRELRFDFDWRDMSRGSVNESKFELFLKPELPYVEKKHRQPLEKLASVTSHPEESGRILAFLARHHPEIERFASRTGRFAFRVTYGSQLTISSIGPAMALAHLAGLLTRHFTLERGSAIVLNGTVLQVDAMEVNAYEVGQCIGFLLGVLEVFREMGGEWLLGRATPLLDRFLPSLADAPAWLSPQGIVRLLLRMEDESHEQMQLHTFFLTNREWLPCDRIDRVLQMPTYVFTLLNAPERLRLTERSIAALLAAGLTGRARDAAKRSLDTLAPEIDLVALLQQSTAGLPPWQLRARSLLLQAAWDRLGPTGSHVELFAKAFSALAHAAATDEAVHDYLDWVQSFAKPEELIELLKALPVPRTWHGMLRQREISWRRFDEFSWRSVTWSLARPGWHDKQQYLSLNGKPVLFRMPFHSALVAKFGGRLTEAEVVNLCIVHSRHLEPAEVPRVAAAVRTWFENLLSMRGPEPGLPTPSDLLSEEILRDLLNEKFIPQDAREKFEQMLAELQELTGSPHEDLLRGLPHLIPLFFQANVREALEWTLGMARLLADRYPDVATKLLNQVPFDAREGQPEWESLSLRVQGLAPKAPAAAGLPVPLVKDALGPTDPFQVRPTPYASASSSVEYVNLLQEYVGQIQKTEPSGMASTGGAPITLAEQCLQDLETAVGLLQQVQCRDPLSLIRGIVQSKAAPILQLIGSGRIGCRVNPGDAPDFCGVRARWQLPRDLKVHEADCVYALATGLVGSSELAGMSLLQALLCQESLEPSQRNRIIDGMFKLWNLNIPAASGTDGAWAGMLLVLELRGLLTEETRQRGVRATLLQRWRAGSDMPVLAAMALIRPSRDSNGSDPETLPTLETLFKRSRGLPDADRIAMWVMRRLHDLDGKEVRDVENRLRSEGAAPLFDDAKKIAEEQLRILGIGDPMNYELDPSILEETNHLIGLWAGCANNSADASKALLRIERYTVSAIMRLAFARLAWALPIEDPDWRRLATRWVWFTDTIPTSAQLAYALLEKFERARLPFWRDEWRTASLLAKLATRAVAARHEKPELARYLAEALDRVLKQGSPYIDERTGYDIQAWDHVERAIELCRVCKTRCPTWYQILLPVTKAATQHVIDGERTPEQKTKLRTSYNKVFARLEQLS